jgi:hypothetical protein
VAVAAVVVTRKSLPDTAEPTNLGFVESLLFKAGKVACESLVSVGGKEYLTAPLCSDFVWGGTTTILVLVVVLSLIFGRILLIPFF